MQKKIAQRDFLTESREVLVARIRTLEQEVVLLRARLDRDSKTKLYNAEGLIHQLIEFYYRERRSNLSAILFIDANHFKKINDTLGHKMGDKAIMRLAKILRQEARLKYKKGTRNKRLDRYDIIARVGGDEFVIFSPGLDYPEDAFKIAERYRKAVAAVDWAAEYKQWRRKLRKLPDPAVLPNPSLAIGIVVVGRLPPKQLQPLADIKAISRIVLKILHIADHQMYEAKNREKATGKATASMAVLEIRWNKIFPLKTLTRELV